MRIITAEELCDCPQEITEFCSDNCKHQRPWGTGRSLLERYRAQRFDVILEVERTAQSERAGAEAGMTAAERERALNGYKRAKDRLYALIDALTDDELKAFAKYRRANR